MVQLLLTRTCSGRLPVNIPLSTQPPVCGNAKVHVYVIYVACVRAIYNMQRRDLYVLHFSLYREYKIKIEKGWINEI